MFLLFVSCCLSFVVPESFRLEPEERDLAGTAGGVDFLHPGIFPFRSSALSKDPDDSSANSSLSRESSSARNTSSETWLSSRENPGTNWCPFDKLCMGGVTSEPPCFTALWQAKPFLVLVDDAGRIGGFDHAFGISCLVSVLWLLELVIPALLTFKSSLSVALKDRDSSRRMLRPTNPFCTGEGVWSPPLIALSDWWGKLVLDFDPS